MQFVVNNPNDKVKLTSAELGEDVPEDYGAELTPNLATGKMVIVPQPVNGAAAEELTDAIVAVLTYTVPDGESTTLTIDASEAKTESNLAGTLVALRMADEYLETGDMIFGQIVDATAAKTQLGSASVAPTLAVIDGTIGVINTDYTEYGADFESCTGYIYGVEPENGESVDSVFEVIGDGEMEIIANEADSEAGTGTIVNVLDLDGNVVETYVLIIFGDIDGDGEITAFDASDAIDHEGWAYKDSMRIEAPELLFAGDIDLDEDVTAFDGSDMIDHEGWAYKDQMRMLQSDIIDQL